MSEISWPQRQQDATCENMTRVLTAGAWMMLCQVRDEPKMDGMGTNEVTLAYEIIARDVALADTLRLIQSLSLGVADEAAQRIWYAFEEQDLGPALWVTLEGMGLDPNELDPTRAG